MLAQPVVSGSGQLRTLEGEAKVCTLRLGISREAIAPSCIQGIALHNVALRLHITWPSTSACNTQIAAATLLPRA